MPELTETGYGRLVVVIGMHRSGTSLVTRGLRALGVHLGDNLSVEASPDNAKGHWEDRDILDFNERLMDSLALQWDVVGEADETAMGAPSLGPLVYEAATLLATKLADRSPWAFKDPRTARLWPFWRRVLAESPGVQADFVWVVRHPLPVAQSLARRDGFSPLKSNLLWLSHNLIPFDDIAANRHVVVDYDRMLGNPGAELQRMADLLDLGSDDEAAFEEFAEIFVDPGLRHFQWRKEADAGAGLELVAINAYKALLRVASGELGLGDRRFLRQWRAAYHEAELFSDAAPRVDVSTVAARGLDAAERRLADEQRRLLADQAQELQKQLTRTLKDQFEDVTGRVERAEARLEEASRRRQEDHAAALQKEIAQTAEHQAEGLAGLQKEIGRAVEDQAAGLAGLQKEIAHTAEHQAEDLAGLQEEISRAVENQAAGLAGLQKEIGRTVEDQAAGLSGLQRQFVDSLKSQSEESSRRIQELEARVAEEQQRRQEAGLAALQAQFTTTLKDQQTDTSRRIEAIQSRLMDVQAGLERSRADLLLANELLNRERYSLLRPLLRRVYRFVSRTVDHLPSPVGQRLRRLKRKFVPRSMPLTVTIGGGVESGEEWVDHGILQEIERLPGCFDILVCPVIDWHFRIQRPQQLARQLAARGHRIVYLTTTFGAENSSGFRVLESPAPNVVLVELALPGSHPNIYRDPMSGRERSSLAESIGRLRNAMQLDNLVAIVDLPFWRPLVESVPGCLMVYDCMDYHAGFSTNSPTMIEEEARLLVQADLVITTSAGLSEIVGETAPNVLIRNAGEIDYFSKAPATPAYSAGRPVAGYLGAIADWFDIDLVTAAAERYPDWDFVLVGSTEHCDVTQARKLANVKLIGEVPYEEAAAWVHSFDVAMIPFRLTELTRCTNPVKVYEYLAAGKPVVATALPEMQLMGEVSYVADGGDAFIDLLGAAMAERDDAALAAGRREWAAAHDWKNRAVRLEEAVRGSFPKISVIVLTYNNLEFTRACLHSLEVNTAYPDWELVLVDNASTDGSREFLADYASGHARAKLIQNDENLGFAAGNNRGLEASEGEYLVILNNDTYVTPGWLTDLVRHLRRDAGLGLVGAVTNNIGNEAKIDIHYADMADMEKAALAYTSSHPRETLAVNVVAFFCAAMPRAVFEEVGGLDERFGLGFFEDDDYCKRLQEAGYRIAIAEDVFVHHHLSASFDALDRKRREALFERNKALYEEKWGSWTPHRYRDQQ